ncbi:MAG: PhnD/SsuA/transferrin family substrate-binding protein [Prochloraceae cyanobacterium]|nr:PhnD/SsuA/transferrin family substrate-binding protein [Prochloraceae cyanobacterium]
MPSRPVLLAQLFLLGLLAVSCNSNQSQHPKNLTIGVVSYDSGNRSLDKYEDFKNHLAREIRTYIELEPAYNELKAVEQIKRQIWSIVFASPGLAAIAIEQENYIAIFPMEGLSNTRSVIVVREESAIANLEDLSDKVVALGQPGSATGYYLPLYDLYGLTLAEIRFAPTPKNILQLLSDKSVDAGALSESKFQSYQREFPQTKFRILHKTRAVPPGVVLVSPKVERIEQQQIIKAMKEASPNVIADAGYIVDGSIPDYKQFIELIKKVRPLETRVHQKPAVLTIDEEPATTVEN